MPQDEVQDPAAKKKWSKRARIIMSSTAISLMVIIALLILTVMNMGVGNSCACVTPTINTNKVANATTVCWTVDNISGGALILKSDVNVWLKASSGIATISGIVLLNVTSTQGFMYIPASTGDYISVGDVFSLDSIMYSHGSTLTLMPSPTSINANYCVLTV